ncbi:MAG: ornithine cyclodeaminase [Acidobacteriota bacterium]|jgi:ornithine cyclodeaminase/alanine dehydrogenase-like protein (mu-crystallin family)|nr:ornithine cyclodeaminase [Acidobacteriota bacterium]
MSSRLLFLSAADVDKAMSMTTAIAAVREAFVDLSKGEADVPLRTPITLAGDGGALFMPVHLPRQKQLGVKVVTVIPENRDRDLPTIQALVTIFDAETGSPLAVMDGELLTAMRTGAASGVATDALARKNASVAAVIGAGVQGMRQLEAVCCVRTIREALVFDPDRERAEAFASEMGRRLGGRTVRVLDSVSAVFAADVVCTATSSGTPVVADSDLAKGAHVNAIGAYRPNTREIPGEAVGRATLVVDSREACMAEAGELVMAIAEGQLDGEVSPAEIGEVLAGLRPGRAADADLTIFKSVGNAVQDLAVAGLILEEARRLELGTEVEL